MTERLRLVKGVGNKLDKSPLKCALVTKTTRMVTSTFSETLTTI